MLIAMISLALLAMSAPSVFLGVLNAGNISLMAAGGICLAAFLFRRRIRRLLGRRYQKLRRIGKGIVYSGCLVLLVGCVLLEAGGRRPPDGKETGEDQVLIVLGAQIKGDQPGLTLSARLDAAYDYLAAHEGCLCIVSGGQGADEAYSEAAVMAAYLQERGIDGARILKEEKAGSTRENIACSLALLEQEGEAYRQVILVSDAYHLLRARLLADQAGVTAATLPAKTHPLLVWPYRVRELFALGKDMILWPLLGK